LRYWRGNGLAIHTSRVQVLAWQHCGVALGKPLTPVCPCHQAVYFGAGQGGWSVWLESNRGPSGKWRQPTTGFM